MRYLRCIGLVPSLLIVGVLGGLLAPLSSEAGTPTVTLKVDSGTASSILITTSSTCTGTEVTLGYTACYAINTNLTVNGLGAAGGVQRSYNVRNAPGATARLRVGDTAGSDKFSLIGVQFIPAVTDWGSAAANANETHVLTIAMSQTFDSAANLNNKGTYVWALRAGGEFRAGPTTSNACVGFTTTGACNNVQNSVTFPGTGTFSTALVNKPILSPAGAAANTQPLSFTVAGPTAAVVSFNGLTNTTLGQVNPTYPSFVCDLNGGTLATGDVCKPSITQTMTVTLKGPDAFVLVNGGDNFAANCAATLSDKQQKQIAFLTKLVTFLNWLESRRPDPRLSAFIDRIEAFLATINSNPTGEGYDPPCPGARLVDLDIAVAAANDQVAFLADGAVPAEPAPPAPETGTIDIQVATRLISDPCGGELYPPCAYFGGIFNFLISDSGGGQPALTAEITVSDVTGVGAKVVTVAPGTYSVVELAQSGWILQGSTCFGGQNDGPTTSVVVHAGDIVTCAFNPEPAPVGTGKIVIVTQQRISYPAVQAGITYTFGFTGAGQGLANFSLTPDAITRTDSKTFSGLVTGVAGSSRAITETDFSVLSLPSPYPPNGYWYVVNVPCVSQLGIESGTTWVSSSNPGGAENTPVGVTVTNLADGDTLTCTFFNYDYAY